VKDEIDVAGRQFDYICDQLKMHEGFRLMHELIDE